jgi:septum formation protein
MNHPTHQFAAEHAAQESLSTAPSSVQSVGRPLILASRSPRRKALLAELGLSFTIHPSSVPEEVQPHWTPEELVVQLARQKAENVARSYASGVVLGADTIVFKDGIVLGKPKDEQHAFEMLDTLQGDVHTVFSGVALLDIEQKQLRTGYRATRVKMKPLSSGEIERYIHSKEPMDKAGAYGIQGLGAILVEEIEGDYFSVVGLPLQLVADLLKSMGIDLLEIALDQ